MAGPGAGQAGALTPANHPRLLIGPSRLPVYRARAAARTPQWTALKRHVDTFFGEPISTYFVPSFSALFALVYQVTGEARYGDRAAALAPKALQYMVASGQAPHPNLNFYREEVCSLAFAYDWAYDRLAPADRAAIASFLSTAAEHYVTNWYSNGADPVGNLTAGQVRANAVIAVALAGDYPKAQALFDANRRFYIEKAVPALNSIAQGGALPEGSDYNGEIAHHYLQFLQIVKENTGEDLYSLAPFQKDLLYCTLHSTSPTGPRAFNQERNIVKRQPMPFGDIQTDAAEKLVYYVRMYMTQLADYFRASGQQTLANYSQYWLTQMAPYYFDHTPGIATTFLNDFLYSDPKASARDYRFDLPPDYLASGNGRMLSRLGLE